MVLILRFDHFENMVIGGLMNVCGFNFRGKWWIGDSDRRNDFL